MNKIVDLTRQAEERCLQLWKQGPSRTRWSSLPPQVGDPAPDLELTGPGGGTARLSDYWENSPALVLFWRHFGCGCGMDRARRLQNEYEDYLQEGAKVFIIGQGDHQRAAEYAEKYELPPVDILVDPEERAYRAYGLLEGKPSQVVFDAPVEFQRGEVEPFQQLAAERREKGRPLVDNPWLLPGEFVVDREGTLRLTYRYNFCENFPDYRVLLAAIREARWAFE